MSVPIEGGCHCGALRYRVDEPLQHSSYCHCRICQRTMGSPAGVFAGPIKPENFRYTTGEPKSSTRRKNPSENSAAPTAANSSSAAATAPASASTW